MIMTIPLDTALSVAITRLQHVCGFCVVSALLSRLAVSQVSETSRGESETNEGEGEKGWNPFSNDCLPWHVSRLVA